MITAGTLNCSGAGSIADIGRPKIGFKNLPEKFWHSWRESANALKSRMNHLMPRALASRA
jgi:hypothetical protein